METNEKLEDQSPKVWGGRRGVLAVTGAGRTPGVLFLSFSLVEQLL